MIYFVNTHRKYNTNENNNNKKKDMKKVKI